MHGFQSKPMHAFSLRPMQAFRQKPTSGFHCSPRDRWGEDLHEEKESSPRDSSERVSKGGHSYPYFASGAACLPYSGEAKRTNAPSGA